MRRLRWKLSRRKAERYARTHGFFWAPCPRCGVPFSGHEWRTAHEIPKDDGTGQNQAICPPCAYEIGSAFDGICRVEGHEFNEYWNMRILETSQEGNRTSVHGTFDIEMPPSTVLCERCFVEFDPLTRERIGRPLK